MTFSGKIFFPFDPRPEEVDPVDIARSLSLINRYLGHTRKPINVAWHSIMVAKVLDLYGESCEIQLWGLLHDASEAYVGDMLSPIKHHSSMAAFRRLERKIMAKAVCPRFGLTTPEPSVVKKADRSVRGAECRDIRGYIPRGVTPAPIQVTTPSADDCESMFLEKLHNLLSQREALTCH